MRTALIAGLLVAAAARGHAAEPSLFHVSGAAGFAGLGSLEAVHLSTGLGYSPKPFLTLGADLSYSYLPLARQARGGGNRAYWGLATVTAAARPGAKVSPYAVLGYGIGRYEPSWSRAESGNAFAFGLGLNVRLSPRASLFMESRLAIMGGIGAADGLHGELPVKVGVRFRP